MMQNKITNVVLKTVNLRKQYGNLVAVNDLNLEVFEGEIFGFLGPNGAGKSTSINMLCGLLKPDSGQVLLHGKPLKSGDKETKAKVGVCPQSIILWNRLTCMEQLVFIARLYSVDHATAKKRAGDLLNVMGLSEKRNKLASTLSGGMQRRLNIIMAVVHDPEIVIFDEPEAGLDPQSRILVRDYIKSLAKKKTVILTTHNMDEAERVCDRIAIIDHGHLLLEDTPDRLKNKVGEGDVLEFEVSGIGKREEILKALLSIVPDTKEFENLYVLRALGIVNKLPHIIQVLEEMKLEVKELKLRENTLEDVFISLTGKKLRQ